MEMSKTCYIRNCLMEHMKLEDFEHHRRFLSKNSGEINCIHQNGHTLLTKASEKGETKIVEFLLVHGADVNKSTSKSPSKSPLAYALSMGHLDIVKILLKKSANRNALTSDGNTPLALAVQHKHFEVVKYLTATGASFSTFSPPGRTPLSWAVKNEDIEMIQWILNHGGEHTIHSAFFDAIETKNIEIVRLLRDNGALINHRYQNGYTPLTKASEIDSLSIVEDFVNNGAQINLIDRKGWSPIEKSLEFGNYDITRYLFVNGANITATKKQTYLIKYMKEKNFEMIKVLIEIGADLHLIGKDVLIKFVEMENYDIVKYLIKTGADINQIDDSGRTPLSVAAATHNFKMFQILVDSGADFASNQDKIEESANSNEDFKICLQLWKNRNEEQKRREEVMEEFIGHEAAPI